MKIHNGQILFPSKKELNLLEENSVNNWFKVFVNGIFIPSEKYSYYVSSSANEVEFNFSTGSIGSASSTTLGYELSGSDEFAIVGKFKEV